MHVDNHSNRSLLQSSQFFLRHLKRTVQSRHVRPSHELEHTELLPAGRFDDHTSISGHTARIIGGSKESWLPGEIVENFFLIPRMVTGRNDCEAEVEQLFCQLRRNTEPTGCVFSISDHDVYLPLGHQPGDSPGQSSASRLTKNIANIEDLHLAYSTYRLSRITVTLIVPG